jgi:serine/threonine protein kinase
MQASVGMVTEEFTLLRELGRGGMGTVFLAEDHKLGKVCACKVLHTHLTQDTTARARFRNEARAAAAVDHPAIVKTYAIDELPGGLLCCRMEYVEGMTLAAFCQRRGEPLPLGLILQIIGPICEAFDLLHALHIVHRDLKPDNVLIVQRGAQLLPRVLDFGIAKRINEPGLTSPGAAPGTACYMAPEQARGGNVDRSCDVYSLGVMIYWMATGGHLPFESSSGPLLAPIDPRRHFSAIPELAAEVMLTAIHADPARRPRSMGSLALMVARCVVGDGIQPDGTAILRTCAPNVLVVGNLDETMRSPNLRGGSRGTKPAIWKYEYGLPLGRGGMAEVVRATLRGEGQFAVPRAVKLILPEFAESPDFVTMFKEEARTASLLDHRNIVRVLDHDLDPMGRLYLAMEFIDGVDLNQLRLAGPIPHAVIIFVLCEVLEALDYIHDLPPTSPLASSQEIAARGNVRGLVHRDVSHHNVLISLLADVKLADFGIAKVRESTLADGSKLIKGKAGYMSPEQAAASNKIDGRSDLWAIGVMLWELLTTQTLFNQETFAAILAAVRWGDIPRPRLVRPDVPPDLDAIAVRLLERELGRRFQTAREVIAALRACQAASRDGRGELERLLAERFPDRARPVRDARPAASTPDNAQGEESSSPGSRAYALSTPGSAGAPWQSPSTTGHAVGQSVPVLARRTPWRWIAALGLTVVVLTMLALAKRTVQHATNAAPLTASSPIESAPTRSTPSIAPPSANASGLRASRPSSLSAVITVTTNPPGATVRIEAENTPTTVERSPRTVRVAPGTQLHIRAELEGFKTATQDMAIGEERQFVVLTLAPLDAEVPSAKTVRRADPTTRAATGAKPKATARTVSTPNDDPGIIE